MYESFYGLREKPFSLLPDPSFLYLSDKHRTALALLEYGLANQAGFSVVTGGIGTGKTTLVRHLLNHLDNHTSVGLITNTHRSFGELLQWILLAFDLDHSAKDKVDMYQVFVDFMVAEYARRHRTVLIVDEAQNMAAETLEELRMLSNVNADKDQVLQIVLIGQAGLRETLRRPDLLQFAQRIAVDYHLEPLDSSDTCAYIRHRLQVAGGDTDIFDADACNAVFHHSGGTPRLINLLCDTALVYGYADQVKHISAALIEDVARDKRLGGIVPLYLREDTPVSTAAPNRTPEFIDDTVQRLLAELRNDTTELQRLGTPPAPAKMAAVKKKLRIAVGADSEQQRDQLKAALEKSGVEVVATASLYEDQFKRLSREHADILLIGIDDDAAQELRYLEEILDELQVPLLFHDSPARRLHMEATRNLEKKLAGRLSPTPPTGQGL